MRKKKINPKLKTFTEWLKYLEDDLIKQKAYEQLLKAC